MKIKNAKNWSAHPRPRAYLMALLITMVAFGIRYMLHPLVQPYAPLQMFFLACLITEYMFGLGPALLSGSMGLLLGLHYFIAPYGEVDAISRSDIIVTLNYAFVTLFAVGLIEYLQRALYSNHLLLKVSQSRHKISLYRENDRLYLARKTSATLSAIDTIFSRFDQVLLLKLANGSLYPQSLLYQLSGWPARMQGKDGVELFHADDLATLLAHMQQIENGGAGRALQIRLMQQDGTHEAFQVRLERITIDTVEVVALILQHMVQQSAAAAVDSASDAAPSVGPHLQQPSN